MLFKSQASLLLVLGAFVGTAAVPTPQRVLDVDFGTRTNSVTHISAEEWNSWLAAQTHKSFEAIIQNVGNGTEVVPGAVIASPSKHQPDYFYIWTRDAGITMDKLITAYNDTDAANATLKHVLDCYANSSYYIQRTGNPSGGFDNLDGLGEPKFEVDASPFTSNWGRPQRCGPGFRAVALLNFYNAQVLHLDLGHDTFQEHYYTVVKPDLDYVASKWDLMGFDYWEEVNGTHLATTLIQLKSMKLGMEFARQVGDSTWVVYQRAARDMARFLSQYFDHDRGHLVETLGSSRSGLDAAVLIGTLQAALNNDMGCELTPASDHVINYLWRLVNTMRYRYNINRQRIESFRSRGVGNIEQVGVGIGRYPEDVYDGYGNSNGNPWFLCTASVAEVLYNLADHLHSAKRLALSDHTRPFYAQFGVYDNVTNHKQLMRLIKSIVNYADSFMDVIREHQSADGHMSEQFSRYDGYMQGARDLTWSYGAFWSASRQRSRIVAKLT